MLMTYPIVIFSQDCKMDCLTNLVIPASKGKEGTIVHFPSAFTAGECTSFNYTPSSGSFFRLGSHSVIATSNAGQKCSFTIVITDQEPPVLSEIYLSRSTLWPISNKMKKIKVKYNASDNGGEVASVLTVSSNAGEQANDWEILPNNEIRLKATRLPDDSPRIYTITVTATDTAGNKTKRSTSIAVSETMVAKKAP